MLDSTALHNMGACLGSQKEEREIPVVRFTTGLSSRISKNRKKEEIPKVL